MTKAIHAAHAATVVVLVCLFIAASTTSSQADKRKIRIFNETRQTMVEFYATSVGNHHWDDDLLDHHVLDSGDSLMIEIDDGTGYCMYDFRAVFADGDTLVRNRINICQISSYRYQDHKH
ncbi:MAG: hypothetical protein CMI60_06985 [Parvibaculum sp.]|nr:hypothetical protein [Parvibaculum sp.]